VVAGGGSRATVGASRVRERARVVLANVPLRRLPARSYQVTDELIATDPELLFIIQ